jgi:hypothetical protein
MVLMSIIYIVDDIIHYDLGIARILHLRRALTEKQKS